MADGSGIASDTTAVVMAIIAITTINSSSVNPRWRMASLPGTDIGIPPFATALTIRAETEHIDGALHTRVDVLVAASPWIVGQLLQIGLPLDGIGARGGLGHQRLQALLAGREAHVVQLVELERLHQVGHVSLGCSHTGIVCTIQHGKLGTIKAASK